MLLSHRQSSLDVHGRRKVRLPSHRRAYLDVHGRRERRRHGRCQRVVAPRDEAVQHIICGDTGEGWAGLH